MIKVMLVDDDPEITKYVGQYLKKLGFDTRCAASGEEALKMITKDVPDCILLDIHMPGGIDGVETLIRVKEINKDIKVVMITGFVEEELESVCKSEGACDFIIKPIDYKSLDGLIKGSVGNQ